MGNPKNQDAMVTGRVDAAKKARGNAVLERLGLNPSQAINLMYDRLIADQDAAFLGVVREDVQPAQLLDALDFIRGMQLPATDMFDGMTKGEIKAMRFASREARHA